MNETTQNVSETSSETTTLTKEARNMPEPREATKEETTISETSSDTSSTDTSSSETTNTETTATTEQPAPEVFSMSVPFLSLSILECVLAFCLIGVVLQQSKNATGITSSSAVGGNSDSYWNKNKSRSKESKLIRLTIILAIAFFIVTLALGFVK